MVPSLRFPGFEVEWVKNKLGNLFGIKSSSRVHKHEWSTKGVPFFRTSDVVSFFNGTKNKKAYIPFELYNSLSNKMGRVKKNDLLVTGGGSIGIPFLIKNNEPLFFKDADLLWIQNINNLNGYFIYSYFVSESFRKYLKGISHIGTIAHYTIIQAKKTPCFFPSLQEQQKIASFLSSVDDKISQLEKKKTLLETYKRGIMQKIFSQELRFKDENGQEFSEWELTDLGSISDIKIGEFVIKTKQSPNGKFPVYNGGKTETGYYDEYNNEGDKVIISARGANAGYVNYEKNRFWGGNSCYSIKILNGNNTIFFFQQIKHFQRKFTDYQQAANIPSVSKKDVAIFKVSVPIKKEQQKIASFLSSIDNKIEITSTQLEKTREFKKGLLQQMFV